MNKNQIEVRHISVRTLLDGVKYSIDTYQREYNWKSKQISELLEDLSGRFLEEYKEDHERSQVENYPHYFLGSIIVSTGSSTILIVDGQQRLISLTLLLIYLNNLQINQQSAKKVSLDNLIYSERFGSKSFNIDIPGLTEQIDMLYHHRMINDFTEKSEQVILARYNDIELAFPEKLKGSVLPYFIDWLKESVDFVEINTFSEEEANIIFETMNDRGIPLSPTDRLKSYLLSKIISPLDKNEANELWKKRVLELIIVDESDASFFTSWLSAKYVEWPNGNERDAYNEISRKVRLTFHKWVRDNAANIGLRRSNDFRDFIMNRFDFFVNQYLRIRLATFRFTPDLEDIYYFTRSSGLPQNLREHVLLAPLLIDDDLDTIDFKIRLVAKYLDILNVYYIVNSRTQTIINRVQSGSFNTLIMKIRNLNLQDLAALLKNNLVELPLTFEGLSALALVPENRRYIRYLLARITSHIEKQIGIESSFEIYYSQGINKPFEIEHLWANKYEQHMDEFPTKLEFEKFRNRIGGLVLLPQGINQSFNASTYTEKISYYYGQNLLAQSLHPHCYQKNPSFLRYIERSGLPFEAYPTQFSMADFEKRAELYKRICEEIWNTTIFDL